MKRIALLVAMITLAGCEVSGTNVKLECDVTIYPDTIVITAHPDSVHFCEAAFR